MGVRPRCKSDVGERPKPFSHSHIPRSLKGTPPSLPCVGRELDDVLRSIKRKRACFRAYAISGIGPRDIPSRLTIGVEDHRTLCGRPTARERSIPRTERVESGVTTAEMFSAVVSPLFLFMAVCMFFTANTELSTNQWIDKLLGNAGANALLILALVNGIMAVGRFFGGPIIHRLNPIGVLLGSSIVAVAGVWMLRSVEGPALYAAAVVFAIGVCYFWPTMLGFVNENIPKSGALGLSLMGGVGMLGNWAFQTFFIGHQLDAEKMRFASEGIPADKVELMAGQSVLGTINWLPVFLVLAFGGLWFYLRGRKQA